MYKGWQYDTIACRSAALCLPLRTDAPYAALRKQELRKVVVYGDITDAEKDMFRYLAERNAINDGVERSEVVFIENPEKEAPK